MTSPTSGTYVLPPSRGDCPTGKVQYATRKQARAGRRYRGLDVSIYRCEACGWLHLGHLPQRVRNGEISKDAWQAATRGKGKS